MLKPTSGRYITVINPASMYLAWIGPVAPMMVHLHCNIANPMCACPSVYVCQSPIFLTAQRLGSQLSSWLRLFLSNFDAARVKPSFLSGSPVSPEYVFLSFGFHSYRTTHISPSLVKAPHPSSTSSSCEVFSPFLFRVRLFLDSMEISLFWLFFQYLIGSKNTTSHTSPCFCGVRTNPSICLSAE